MFHVHSKCDRFCLMKFIGNVLKLFIEYLNCKQNFRKSEWNELVMIAWFWNAIGYNWRMLKYKNQGEITLLICFHLQKWSKKSWKTKEIEWLEFYIFSCAQQPTKNCVTIVNGEMLAVHKKFVAQIFHWISTNPRSLPKYFRRALKINTEHIWPRIAELKSNFANWFQKAMHLVEMFWKAYYISTERSE